MEKNLFITEIFKSLQGEGTRAGLPSIFIRLSGCPLRCKWCDTTYSFTKGKKMTIAEVLQQTKSFGIQEVCVTGGEPLAQKNVFVLLKTLCDEGFHVSLETSGALSIEQVDARVANILDFKAPNSGELNKNYWENLRFLKKERDEIKIIIASRTDFDWAIATINHHNILKIAPVIFSAAAPLLKPQMLAEWILETKLPIRLQLQLHKILWNDARGK